MSDPATNESTVRPTLAAVAALAGVSRSTASIAFSGSGPVADDTRARVFAAAASLGYGGPDPMARSLRRGRSGIVGVVIEDRLRDAFRDVMNIAMLDGIADEIGSAGCSLLLLTDTPAESTNPDASGGSSAIATAPLDAVVLIGCSTRLDRAVDVLRRRGIPIVAIEAEPMPGVLEVALDNREASAAGARYLQGLGHRDLAVVTLPLGEPRVAAPLPSDWELSATAFTGAERLRGVRDVFGAVPGRSTRASTVDEGYLAGRALLEAPGSRPTAIIAQSDLLAIGVLRAAIELGISVPEQLSVLGFDGIRTDGYGPWMLSTLVQPAVEKGRAAGRAIAGLLAGESVDPVLLRCELRVGDTTAPPATSPKPA